jgi:hypothetical protein
MKYFSFLLILFLFLGTTRSVSDENIWDRKVPDNLIINDSLPSELVHNVSFYLNSTEPVLGIRVEAYVYIEVDTLGNVAKCNIGFEDEDTELYQKDYQLLRSKLQEYIENWKYKTVYKRINCDSCDLVINPKDKSLYQKSGHNHFIQIVITLEGDVVPYKINYMIKLDLE